MERERPAVRVCWAVVSCVRVRDVCLVVGRRVWVCAAPLEVCVGVRRRDGREENRVDAAEVGRGGLEATTVLRLGNSVASERPAWPLPRGKVLLNTMTGFFKTDSTSTLSKESTTRERGGDEARFWREDARDV